MSVGKKETSKLSLKKTGPAADGSVKGNEALETPGGGRPERESSVADSESVFKQGVPKSQTVKLNTGGQKKKYLPVGEPVNVRPKNGECASQEKEPDQVPVVNSEDNLERGRHADEVVRPQRKVRPATASSSPVSFPVEKGLTRNKLEIARLIIQGGIAKLTVAVTPTGEQVVFREILPKYRFDARIRRKFNYGTKVRKMLTPHPNICASLSRRPVRVTPYEVIEFVPGSNLQDLISKKNPLVQENRFEILRQCATALSYVHSHGILHLDVKASNFLLDTTGDELRVKLTDFDLSCPQSVHRDPRRSGTLRYMPPEQVISGAVSIMSDMFAFGVMAYNLVTGQSPFPGEDTRQERSRQLSKSYKIVDPLLINPDLTPKLAWVIMRCLEKNPENRFPDMAYLCQELGR